MKTSISTIHILTAALTGTVALAGIVLAKGPPAPEEGAGNNLSFPIILAEGLGPADLVETYPITTFAPIASTADCTTGVPSGSAVPTNILCYYSQSKVWWLQERAENKWQAYVARDPNPATALPDGTPVDVSAVDVGDLLESSTTIKAKQIRTEFTLLMDAASDDDFAGSVLDPFDPTFTLDTFQAFGMSGAVPGTEQSINEIQGTDFGPGPSPGLLTGTLAMVDPTTVLLNNEGIPVHATVYSRCARLIIQKITDFDNLAWSSDLDDGSGHGGYWAGGALAPVVNIAAWDDTYSAEINAGGLMLYGYNWNTMLLPQAEKSGNYRLTFLLEGGPSGGGQCDEELNTVFDTTLAVNLGEQHPAEVLSATELAAVGAHHGEGGAVYVDVVLGASGGGGKGGGKGG